MHRVGLKHASKLTVKNMKQREVTIALLNCFLLKKQQLKTPVPGIFGWKEAVWRPPLPSGQTEAHASLCSGNSLEEPLRHFIFALENTVAQPKPRTMEQEWCPWKRMLKGLPVSM